MQDGWAEPLPFHPGGEASAGLAGPSGEGRLQGSKDDEPLEGETTGIGRLKKFVPVDLPQRGGISSGFIIWACARAPAGHKLDDLGRVTSDAA